MTRIILFDRDKMGRKGEGYAKNGFAAITMKYSRLLSQSELLNFP